MNQQQWGKYKSLFIDLLYQAQMLEHYSHVTSLLKNTNCYLPYAPPSPKTDNFNRQISIEDILKSIDKFDWMFSGYAELEEYEVLPIVVEKWKQLKKFEGNEKALDAIGYNPFKSSLPDSAGVWQAQHVSKYFLDFELNFLEQDGKLVIQNLGDYSKGLDMGVNIYSGKFVWRKIRN